LVPIVRLCFRIGSFSFSWLSLTSSLALPS
jgi:hypothetical protein